MRRLVIGIIATVSAATAVLTLGSCGDRDLLNNPGFDLWCGDELCNWEVASGAVSPAPTWHDQDLGALLSGGVVMSQLSESSAGDADCIAFEIIANGPGSSSLTVELDFLDNGNVDYSATVSLENWAQSRQYITPPAWFDGIRFRLRQTGDDVTIAQLRATAVEMSHCGAEPIVLTDLPDGAECLEPAACGGGACTTIDVPDSTDDWSIDTCGTCESSEDCGPDEACGVTLGDYFFSYQECGPSARHALGDHCATDGECATGVCCEGQCSECCAAGSCAGGGTCARTTQSVAGAPLGIMPFMCDRGPRETGEACLGGTDCLSGLCDSSEGDLRICDPGGSRCDTDADCPWAVFGGTCETLGRASGTCR